MSKRKILKIISEHKSKLKGGRKTNKRVKADYKRVEAIISKDGMIMTRHIDIKKDENV